MEKERVTKQKRLTEEKKVQEKERRALETARRGVLQSVLQQCVYTVPLPLIERTSASFGSNDFG